MSALQGLVRSLTYPGHDGQPIRRDPTYGRISRPVQWFVQDVYQPRTVSQRVVMEINVQRAWERHRDRRELVVCPRRQCRGRVPHSRLVHWFGWVRR